VSLLLALALAAGAQEPRPAGTRLASLQDEAAEVARALREAVPPEAGEDPGRAEDARAREVAEALLRRVAELRGERGRSPQMRRVLTRVEELVRLYPERWYAREHPGGMTRAIARTLEENAREARSPAELERKTRRDLDLPADEAGLPTNVPLEKFKKLGPIVIFILKHRTSEPEAYLATTPEDLMANKHNVEVGVSFQGRVTRVNRAVDGDVTFDVSVIHNEITPQFLRSPSRRAKLHMPRVGDLVEVKGWSYYDWFHRDEAPEEQVITEGRPTVWEVHPVIELRLIQAATP
jgi:hypothetical protein